MRVETELPDSTDSDGLTGRELLLLHELRGLAGPPAPEPPRLDDDGLLWYCHRWVVIPDSQLAVVQYLLDHPNQLVRNEVIRLTYTRAGLSGHPGSIRTMMNRVKRRLAAVGLTLHGVHSKGVILELPPA